MKPYLALSLLALFSLAAPASAGGGKARLPVLQLPPEKPVYPPDLANIEAACYIESIDDIVYVFQSVAMDIHNLSAFSEAARRSGGLGRAKKVLDIGTGAGTISFLLLGYGAGSAVGTDIDPLALKNARFNARRLGFRDRFEARLVPMSDTGAFSVVKEGEKFDLIVSDPPQAYTGEEAAQFPVDKDRRNYFRFDPGGELLSSIAAGLKKHLAPGGRAWISLRTPVAKALLRELAAEHGLGLRIVFSGKDDVDYEEVRFLPPMPYKDRLLYDGKTRMRDAEIFEVTVKGGGR